MVAGMAGKESAEWAPRDRISSDYTEAACIFLTEFTAAGRSQTAGIALRMATARALLSEH